MYVCRSRLHSNTIKKLSCLILSNDGLSIKISELYDLIIDVIIGDKLKLKINDRLLMRSKTGHKLDTRDRPTTDYEYAKLS